MVHLVASGEVSGKLEQMLQRAAQLETQALERRLAVFLTLLEPVMILVMGGVVLMIVLAILLPIIEINQPGALSRRLPAAPRGVADACGFRPARA